MNLNWMDIRFEIHIPFRQPVAVDPRVARVSGDVTLQSCDGQSHMCHRLVLWAASTALKSLLGDDFSEGQQIQQGQAIDIAASGDAVGAMLDHIYGGEPEISLEVATELLRLAGAYGLPKLVAQIEVDSCLAVLSSKTNKSVFVGQLSSDSVWFNMLQQGSTWSNMVQLVRTQKGLRNPNSQLVWAILGLVRNSKLHTVSFSWMFQFVQWGIAGFDEWWSSIATAATNPSVGSNRLETGVWRWDCPQLWELCAPSNLHATQSPAAGPSFGTEWSVGGTRRSRGARTVQMDEGLQGKKDPFGYVVAIHWFPISLCWEPETLGAVCAVPGPRWLRIEIPSGPSYAIAARNVWLPNCQETMFTAFFPRTGILFEGLCMGQMGGRRYLSLEQWLGIRFSTTKHTRLKPHSVDLSLPLGSRHLQTIPLNDLYNIFILVIIGIRFFSGSKFCKTTTGDICCGLRPGLNKDVQGCFVVSTFSMQSFHYYKVLWDPDVGVFKGW